ncbi:D-glycero-beta-D-manno-heptose-7-phosphate kinase [Derxia gummosa]|uniref:D-glycero-beta-D-manno-heptose-7-phosphate kinase n=1 Tax=Derxia gummosa DSM 723 TaxID=1121388 RepID=A0A8B6X8W2_9BURK|nr:D-glycero-beta-D-manno-heptose-7-phosphate kinase [Derxia gummosa]
MKPFDPLSLSAARILVVGDVMLDRYWFGDVSRISPEAPVPVVLVNRTEDRLGGAANVGRNIASLGARAELVGVIGRDEAGQRVRALIAEAGMSDALFEDVEMPTIVKLRVLGRQQQLVRVDFERKPGHEVLEAALGGIEQRIANADVVVLSDYGKGGLAHIAHILSSARAANKPVIIDPKGADYERYRGATVLTPNRSELAQVVGGWSSEADLHAKAEQLRASLDVQALLLTRSEEGMTLFTAGSALNFPAVAREVFDVSGAGDTVVATLASLVAVGLPLAEAVPVANRAGGIVVGKVGTAVVTRDELFAHA